MKNAHLGAVAATVKPGRSAPLGHCVHPLEVLLANGSCHGLDRGGVAWVGGAFCSWKREVLVPGRRKIMAERACTTEQCWALIRQF